MEKIKVLLEEWDGQEVIIHYDHETNSWIFIAIHSTVLGPADGGTRILFYPDLNLALLDALSLAKGMTFKYALSGIARGGGKAVIAIPDDLEDSSLYGLLDRYGRLIKQLGGMFTTATDIGSSSRDMDVIAQKGAPYVFGGTSNTSMEPGYFAALGIFSAMEAVCRLFLKGEIIRGKRVLIQGVGNVGEKLLECLIGAGARVLFNDKSRSVIERIREKWDVEYIKDDKVYTTECDIFSPNAIGGILNSQTIPRLRCRAVVGGANIQLKEPRHAGMLWKRGIIYAPDYAVNVGAALADLGMADFGWTIEEAKKKIVVRVRDSLEKIHEISLAENIDTLMAADSLVRGRLDADIAGSVSNGAINPGQGSSEEVKKNSAA
uniref:Leucine dehydrogenase n=1 Tax=Candidatus Kentrum sp. FW TaxID=2126338 RepID=A0A450SJJ4_9GAMM|nr:MAG: leucine dehydrogenase [Candidatus Kentron sp. FW]VFJ53557.1 MAG: leucine dehydrogenase [Candidatus Kentron sp. FW]